MWSAIDSCVVPGVGGCESGSAPVCLVVSQMPDHTHSIFAVERSPLVSDGTPTTVCRCCGGTMNHFRTIAKLRVRPQQHVFVYPSCKKADTKELKQVA